jgi:hypothetical protein
VIAALIEVDPAFAPRLLSLSHPSTFLIFPIFLLRSSPPHCPQILDPAFLERNKGGTLPVFDAATEAG